MDLIQPVSRLSWPVLEDLLSDSEGIFQISCQSLTRPFPKRTRFKAICRWYPCTSSRSIPLHYLTFGLRLDSPFCFKFLAKVSLVLSQKGPVNFQTLSFFPPRTPCGRPVMGLPDWDVITLDSDLSLPGGSPICLPPLTILDSDLSLPLEPPTWASLEPPWSPISLYPCTILAGFFGGFFLNSYE